MSDTAVSSLQETGDPVRVMLVDDSAVVRGLMSRALQQDPQIKVVASAADGEMATKVIDQHEVDVIVLDIEMPKMDGLTALPILLEMSPQSYVVMASTLSQRNAEISLRALSMGAADYVPKPSSREDPDAIEQFYHELRGKVKALGLKAHQNAHTVSRPKTVKVASAGGAARSTAIRPASSSVATQRYPSEPPQAIAIAASTGGPQALAQLLAGVGKSLSHLPVFVTQHMPAKFTALLADHLSKEVQMRCVEATHGDVAQAGVVYIAPGNYHMILKRSPNGVMVNLNQEPPINFCRPAADPMFESLSEIYQSRLLAVVLTGMGHDGLAGSRRVTQSGGTVIAQDEASSVVWGMPGAVTQAGLCAAVLPLNDMPAYLTQATAGGRHAAG